MKKAIKKKLSGTKKLVRKVLSKPSVLSNDSIENFEESMAEEALLKNELEALKDQIANLKAAINSLQDEIEQKEITIANLAREKEKISLDLLRTKRSNINLGQQLEDDRKYYLKEKEIYCQEMNECKKLKRILADPTNKPSYDDRTIDEYKNEIQKLKQTLNHTLEANYNLSIKFLRMKNTKTCLKTELQTMRIEHEKMTNDYKSKIENLTSDLNSLVNEKLNSPLSNSSKKYLQLVKHNSCLVYENLCLQLEVDNLNFKFQKCKLEKTKSDTNSRLQYIHHETSEPSERSRNRMSKNSEIKNVALQNEAPEKLEKEPVPSCSGYHLAKDVQIVKLFERVELPGIPEIKIINEKKPKHKRTRKKKVGENQPEEALKAKDSVFINKKEVDITDSYNSNIDKITNKTSTKLTLFQVSDIQTATSSDYVSFPPSIVRSRSSPDLFQNTNKIS